MSLVTLIKFRVLCFFFAVLRWSTAHAEGPLPIVHQAQPHTCILTNQNCKSERYHCTRPFDEHPMKKTALAFAFKAMCHEGQ